MGQSKSSQKAAALEQQYRVRYQSSLELFTPQEQDEIKKSFCKICGVTEKQLEENESTVGFTRSQLETYLSDEIINRFYYKFLKPMQCSGKTGPADVPISYRAFVIAMATVFKGTVEKQCHLISFLATWHMDGVPLDDLSFCFCDILKCYEETLTHCNKMRNWKFGQSEEDQDERQMQLMFVMQYSLFQCVKRDKEGGLPWLIPISDLLVYFQKTPFILKVFMDIFKLCFMPPIIDPDEKGTAAASEALSHDDIDISTLHETQPLPQCLKFDSEKMSTVLDLMSVILLNYHLPHSCQGEWRYCFSSQTEGASFSTLMERIHEQGPLLIIVKDTDARVFGGFGFQSLEQGLNCTGSSGCFLFYLSPIFNIYEASEDTKHNDFMSINANQQTSPIGLGMGSNCDCANRYGQVDKRTPPMVASGFWINEDLRTGHSIAKPKSSLYDDKLTTEENFTVDVLEVWAMGPLPT